MSEHRVHRAGPMRAGQVVAVVIGVGVGLVLAVASYILVTGAAERSAMPAGHTLITTSLRSPATAGPPGSAVIVQPPRQNDD